MRLTEEQQEIRKLDKEIEGDLRLQRSGPSVEVEEIENRIQELTPQEQQFLRRFSMRGSSSGDMLHRWADTGRLRASQKEKELAEKEYAESKERHEMQGVALEEELQKIHEIEELQKVLKARLVQETDYSLFVAGVSQQVEIDDRLGPMPAVDRQRSEAQKQDQEADTVHEMAADSFTTPPAVQNLKEAVNEFLHCQGGVRDIEFYFDAMMSFVDPDLDCSSISNTLKHFIDHSSVGFSNKKLFKELYARQQKDCYTSQSLQGMKVVIIGGGPIGFRTAIEVCKINILISSSQ